MKQQNYSDLARYIMGWKIKTKPQLSASNGFTYFDPKAQTVHRWLDNYGPYIVYWNPLDNSDDTLLMLNEMLAVRSLTLAYPRPSQPDGNDAFYVEDGLQRRSYGKRLTEAICNYALEHIVAHLKPQYKNK